MKSVFILGKEEDYPNYVFAFRQLGANVVASCNDYDCINCDILLLPGGGDIDPVLYGQEMNGSEEPDHERDQAEMRVIARFLAMDKPIIGICRGLQVLNVVFGGTLHQHIPDHSRVEKEIDRVHMTRADDPLLCRLYGEEFPVNSAHHQVIDQLGFGLNAVQWSDEGYIEAVRHCSKPIFAVQWHPERTCYHFERPDAVDGSRLLSSLLNEL